MKLGYHLTGILQERKKHFAVHIQKCKKIKIYIDGNIKNEERCL